MARDNSPRSFKFVRLHGGFSQRLLGVNREALSRGRRSNLSRARRVHQTPRRGHTFACPMCTRTLWQQQKRNQAGKASLQAPMQTQSPKNARRRGGSRTRGGGPRLPLRRGFNCPLAGVEADAAVPARVALSSDEARKRVTGGVDESERKMRRRASTMPCVARRRWTRRREKNGLDGAIVPVTTEYMGSNSTNWAGLMPLWSRFSEQTISP